MFALETIQRMNNAAARAAEVPKKKKRCGVKKCPAHDQKAAASVPGFLSSTDWHEGLNK